MKRDKSELDQIVNKAKNKIDKGGTCMAEFFLLKNWGYLIDLDENNKLIIKSMAYSSNGQDKGLSIP